ncbi:MAG: hypothetical protein QM708_11420 [Propioniciclava sp.]|uniref:hypothetical protein n=1 Tax=Propioniciclava sp. TaxID=2038686 RepID=UPI0039E2DDAD
MRGRSRGVLLAAIVLVVVVAVVIVAVNEGRRTHAEINAPTDVTRAAAGAFDGRPRIVFRSTAPGQLFGKVSVVALDDPQGPRDVTDVACDRVDAIDGRASCLRTERSVLTSFAAIMLDGSWQEVSRWPLPGIPSRTRLSPDGTRVTTTAFVTGHSYSTAGFSTETVIHGLEDPAAPRDLGNIEFYTLTVDGATIAPVDRNMWGITFVDDTTFYATTQSTTLGKTWLVRGNAADQTLEAIAEGVECPSLSPDRTRLAFKATTATRGGTPHWTPAVLDLGTGQVTVLTGERTSLDDQIAWLDDDTILYGLPRADQAGVTDVWALSATRPDATPELFLPQAWSPAIIR